MATRNPRKAKGNPVSKSTRKTTVTRTPTASKLALKSPARKAPKAAAAKKAIKQATVKKTPLVAKPAKPTASKGAATAAMKPKPVRKVATKPASSSKAVTKKVVPKKSAPVKKVVARKPPDKPVAKKASARKSVERTPALARPVGKKALDKPRKSLMPSLGTSRNKPARASRKSAGRKISPDQALAQTQQLLEQKQQHDRELQPWQLLDAPHALAAEQFLQSGDALLKANELHAAESRMKAIQGSSGTQDRRSQRVRDNR